MDRKALTKNIKEHTAYKFAADAHEGQLRKYTGSPYIVHPLSVAVLAVDVFAKEGSKAYEMELACAAALLHDTVEDTHVELTDIESIWGAGVAKAVEGLTSYSKRLPDEIVKDFNRATRKYMDRTYMRVLGATGGLVTRTVHTIKALDILDNTSSIVEHDESFAGTYIPENFFLLPALTNALPTAVDMCAGNLIRSANALGLTMTDIIERIKVSGREERKLVTEFWDKYNTFWEELNIG